MKDGSVRSPTSVMMASDVLARRLGSLPHLALIGRAGAAAVGTRRGKSLCPRGRVKAYFWGRVPQHSRKHWV
jgi:hypothetical protein